jgi:hypothetical protein
MLAQVLVVALLAAAQDADAGREPQTADGGRESTASDAFPPPPTPVPDPRPPPGRLGDPVLRPVPARRPLAPAPAPAAEPRPPLQVGDADGLQAQLTGSLRGSYLSLGELPTDRDLTRLSPSPLETRVRLVPRVGWRGLSLSAEVDLVSGALTGLPSATLRLGDTPHPRVEPVALRQLFVEYRGDTWVARAGQQASHWGLGLVANAGAQDARAGEFGDARFGDLVWRAALAGRPLYRLGGAWRALEPTVALDLVVRDDTASFAEGDRALQGVFALRLNVDPERQVGIYTAFRRQRAAVPADPGDRTTDALVLDVAGRWLWVDEATGLAARVGAEVAWITGRTTLGRSDVARSYALRQLGAVLKGSLQRSGWEGALDMGYASGDHNPYDAHAQAFRFDPDHQVGLLLFREVLGWQTARTYARITDPDLAAVPPEGAALYPTRGAVFNAAYAFPRVRRGIREWLDVYGGPLLAVSTSALADPFNTRLAGGTPRNALDGRPGRYLGTELDVGVQARTQPAAGMMAAATLEAGYFLPGSAFVDARGERMANVAAARVRLSMEF